MEGIKLAVQPFVDDVIGRRNRHGAAKANYYGSRRWLQRGTERVRQYNSGNDENMFSGMIEPCDGQIVSPSAAQRSEEHTSELQSLMRISYAVFCLKKKKKHNKKQKTTQTRQN